MQFQSQTESRNNVCLIIIIIIMKFAVVIETFTSVNFPQICH